MDNILTLIEAIELLNGAVCVPASFAAREIKCLRPMQYDQARDIILKEFEFLRKQNTALQTLLAAKDGEATFLRASLEKSKYAESIVDSEREANEKLTNEIDYLKSQLREAAQKFQIAQWELNNFISRNGTAHFDECG